MFLYFEGYYLILTSTIFYEQMKMRLTFECAEAKIWVLSGDRDLNALTEDTGASDWELNKVRPRL